MTKAFLAVETLTLYRWPCPFEQLARVMVAYKVNVLPTLVAEFLGLFAYRRSSQRLELFWSVALTDETYFCQHCCILLQKLTLAPVRQSILTEI